MFTTTQYILFGLAAVVLVGPWMLEQAKRIRVPSIGGKSSGPREPVDWTLREAVCCLDTDEQLKAWRTITKAIEGHEKHEPVV